MRTNKPKLNPDKTEDLPVRKSMIQVPEYHLTLRVTLPLKEQIHNLGFCLVLHLILATLSGPAMARGAFGQL